MGTMLPPVKASGFQFEVSLISQTDSDVFQTPVTLAAGDCLISKNGSKGWANITVLPTEPGTKGVLKVVLSTSEMNADRVALLFHDALGSQWQDSLISIYTAAQNFDAMKSDTATILGQTGTTGVKLAAGSVTRTAFVLGAITSSAMSTKAVTKIQVDLTKSSMWTTAKAGYVDVAISSRVAATRLTATRAGYLDVALSAIKLKTDLITTTAVITVASPVAAGGDVTSYRGDSYKVGDGRQIEWTIPTDANVVGGSVKIFLDGTLTFTGSVQSAVLLRCADITSTQSNAIAEGSHGMQVKVIQADNDVLTKVIGTWNSLDMQNR